MYAKFAGMEGLQKHHHIRLDLEFKEDCRMWKCFMEAGSSQATCRPFIDIQEVLYAEDMNFQMDAAKGKTLGFRASWDNRWLFGKREDGFIANYNPSIEYLELFGVTIAVFAWSRELRNKRFIIYCDNQSVVAMINNTASKCKNCMTHQNAHM